MADVWDPRDFSIRVGNVDITDITEIDPTFGDTVSSAASPAGSVRHSIKRDPTSVVIRFTAAVGSAILSDLGDYVRGHTKVTVTIITPEYVLTLIDAMLTGYPKPTGPAINEQQPYEITVTGESEGPRYV